MALKHENERVMTNYTVTAARAYQRLVRAGHHDTRDTKYPWADRRPPADSELPDGTYRQRCANDLSRETLSAMRVREGGEQRADGPCCGHPFP
jgi:hypothetical protein